MRRPQPRSVRSQNAQRARGVIPCLVFDERPLSIAVRRSNDVPEVSISSSYAKSGQISTVSSIVKTKYRADVLNNDQSAHTVELTDVAHFYTLPALIRRDECVSSFSASSVAEKNLHFELRFRLLFLR